ncbi:MAG: PIN domain-containing protein [Vicinamibacteria bacterium]
MIYLDTSVFIAHLLAEDRRPPRELWSQSLTSSRLLEYEVWRRVHARSMGRRLGEVVHLLLARLSMLDLERPVLARALEPLPLPVRTVDAIHLASADFLRGHGQEVTIATYDARMGKAARAMEFELYRLE